MLIGIGIGVPWTLTNQRSGVSPTVTNYLIDENGDFLVDENGNKLVWKEAA